MKNSHFYRFNEIMIGKKGVKLEFVDPAINVNNYTDVSGKKSTKTPLSDLLGFQYTHDLSEIPFNKGMLDRIEFALSYARFMDYVYGNACCSIAGFINTKEHITAWDYDKEDQFKCKGEDCDHRFEDAIHGLLQKGKRTKNRDEFLKKINDSVKYNVFVTTLTHVAEDGSIDTLPVIFVPTSNWNAVVYSSQVNRRDGGLKAFFIPDYPMIVVRVNSSDSIEDLTDSLFHEFFHWIDSLSKQYVLPHMYGDESKLDEYFAHLGTMLAPYRQKFRDLISSITYDEVLILGYGWCMTTETITVSSPTEIKSNLISFDVMKIEHKPSEVNAQLTLEVFSKGKKDDSSDKLELTNPEVEELSKEIINNSDFEKLNYINRIKRSISSNKGINDNNIDSVANRILEIKVSGFIRQWSNRITQKQFKYIMKSIQLGAKKNEKR